MGCCAGKSKKDISQRYEPTSGNEPSGLPLHILPAASHIQHTGKQQLAPPVPIQDAGIGGNDSTETLEAPLPVGSVTRFRDDDFAIVDKDMLRTCCDIPDPDDPRMGTADDLFQSCLDDTLVFEGADGEDGVLVSVARKETMLNTSGILPSPDRANPSIVDPRHRSLSTCASPGRKKPLRLTAGTRGKLTSPLPPDICKGLGSAQKGIQCMELQSWKFIGSQQAHEHLRRGGALFCCVPCVPGTSLSDEERSIGAAFVNMSCFANEQKDNGAPNVDLHDPAAGEYLVLLTKAQYLLPSWPAIEKLDPRTYATAALQRKIAPESTTIEDDKKVFDRDKKPAVNTFCQKKPIVMFFKVTTQYRVSKVPDERLPALAALCDGCMPQKALLCERTRGDYGSDATMKAKQLIMYHKAPGGGVLLTHLTITIFTSLPGIVRGALKSLGKKGAEEVQQVAAKARVVFA